MPKEVYSASEKEYSAEEVRNILNITENIWNVKETISSSSRVNMFTKGVVAANTLNSTIPLYLNRIPQSLRIIDIGKLEKDCKDIIEIAECSKLLDD